jgi:hypothetical protein
MGCTLVSNKEYVTVEIIVISNECEKSYKISRSLRFLEMTM